MLRDWRQSPPVHRRDGSAPRPRLPCLRRIACPETATLSEGHCARRESWTFFLFFVLSGECSLGAHGLLRFRTNDVLLGTSGVGVCVSVVSNSPGMLYRFRTATSLSLAAIPCWIPFRKRKVASSKPALTLIYFSHLSGLNFCSRCLLNSIPRSQAVAWCVVRFRHGRQER